MKEPLTYKVLMLMRKRAGQAFDAVDRTDLFEKEYGYRCICVDRRVSQNTGRGYGYAEKTGGLSERGLVLYRVSEKGLGITNFQEFLKNRVVKKYPKKERIRSSMEETAVKKECKALDWTDSIVEEHKTEMNGVSKYETSNGSIVFGPSGMKRECKKECGCDAKLPPTEHRGYCSVVAENLERCKAHIMIGPNDGKTICKMPCMLPATACDTCKEAFNSLLQPEQPRYKKVRDYIVR